MKKLYALIAVLALLLPVLAGCRSSQNTAIPGNATGTQTTPIIPAADQVNQITAPAIPETNLTLDEAIDIALKDAGLTRKEIQDLDIELDWNAGTLHYDVDFEINDRDYDYEIDANTGNILKKEIPQEPENKPVASTDATRPKSDSNSTQKQLTREKARDIALNHAGLTASQVRDLDVELDRDDGILHYDVDFEAGGYEYEYEIHAASGKILHAQKERD